MAAVPADAFSSIKGLKPVMVIDAGGQLVVKMVQASPKDVYAAGFVPANPRAFACFKNVDTNKSGSIDFRELQIGLRKDFGDNRFTQPLCNLLVRVFDTDQTGEIEYNEFEVLFNKLEAWNGFYLAHAVAYDAMGDDGNAGRPRLPKDALKGGMLSGQIGPGGSLPEDIVNMALESVVVERPDAARESVEFVSFPEMVRLLATLEGLKRIVATIDPHNTGEIKIPQRDFIMFMLWSRS